MGTPKEVIARAFPLLLTNHFEIGTVVINAPGPPRLVIPMNPKIIIIRIPLELNPRRINPIPVIRVANGRIILEPYLSTHIPIQGLVNPPTTCLAV